MIVSHPAPSKVQVSLLTLTDCSHIEKTTPDTPSRPLSPMLQCTHEFGTQDRLRLALDSQLRSKAN